MEYTEEQIEKAKKDIKKLMETLEEEETLLENMLAKCKSIKQEMPQYINPAMRFFILICWGMLGLFVGMVLTFVIGQQEYGLWQNIILTQQQKEGLTLFGVGLTFIVGSVTIFTYKAWRG